MGQRRAHELKHDGYRLQIHVRDGRVRPCGANWWKRYPLIPGRGPHRRVGQETI